MRKLLPAVAVLVALGSVTVLVLNRQAATSLAVTELRNQCEELRSQIEGRDQTITELRTSVERSQQSPLGAPTADRGSFPPPGSGAEVELARRIADLTVLQSNTLALVERLTARAADADSPAEKAQRRQAGVAYLEKYLAEHQNKLEASKRRAAELLFGMSIPADISALEPSKALETAALKDYWPYFEARRERDSLQFIMERLQIRLVQEQVDAAGDAQRGTRQ